MIFEMIDRDSCIDCPKQPQDPLNLLRKLCSLVILGDHYIPDTCDGGPFTQTRTLICDISKNQPTNTYTETVTFDCGKVANPSEVINIVHDGEHTIITQGSTVIQDTRNSIL